MTLLQQATLSESNVKPVKRKGKKKEKIKNKEKEKPGKKENTSTEYGVRSIKNEIKKSNQYSPHRLCEMEIAGDCRLVNKNNLLRASSLIN
jgi:hypothetical protein